KLTPFAVDAALLGDYSTPWEQMDRQLGVSTTFINLPAINFKKEEQSHPSQTVEPAMQNQIRQRQGQGQVMDQTLQAFMEDRFAADFSQVRLHTDAQAAQMSKDLGAKAFTTGTDVYFGAGHFQPQTKEGQRLIAHELTHVQQQNGGAIQRKEDPKNDSFADQLEAKLKDGRFGTAFLDLNDHLNWSGLADKKKWLADHPKIRYLFLQNQLGNTVAEVYTPEKLAVMDPKEAFAIIDCWYQTEQDKQELYAAYMPVFENLVQAVHPYSGKNIGDFVKDLVQRIKRQTYASDQLNHEFHSIHLLAPTVHRKVLFYHQHEALFEAVSKKFDPFSGLTLQTYERLTDTNSIDRKEALQIYETLKGVGDEQRRAFLDTALFAGALESDKDAEKYYKQKYKAQYKALPHNWDFALPWNSEHWYTPFADRVTVDHAELMSNNLNYEDKGTRKFVFDRGIDSSINRDKGQTTRDTDRLMEQIETNFENLERLDLLLPVAVRGGLASKVSALIQQKSNQITRAQKKLFTRHGFMPGTNYTYHADKAEAVNYHKWEWWYFTKETLFGGKSGAAISEQRGTFDLTEMQALGTNKGSLGGMKFSKTAYAGDDYYNTTWLDEQVDNHSGSSTLKPNLEATKGAKRRGNVFASIRDSVKQANIYASSLPFEGINYFADGSLYRSGPGVIQGLSIHLSWTKDTSDPDNSIQLKLGIENLELNDLQLIAPKSTIAIGKILTQGFRIDLSQRHLPAAEGLFWGLFKNADFMMKSLMELLPTTIQVLPYAILAMTEEFQGGAAHEYKDAFGDLMQNKFYNLRSTFSFTGLQVKDMYDTTAGFLDDFSISEKGSDGKPKRQTIELHETLSWHIDAQFNIKRRQKSIDKKIREEKSDLMGSDDHEKLTDLETAYDTLFATYMDEKTTYNEKGSLRTKLLDNMSKQRALNQDLDLNFAKFVKENPFYDPLDIIVLEEEKKRLQLDYDYLDKDFHQDQKIAAGDGGRIERFEARKRLAEMEAKYKSFDVDMHLKGIQLQGGNYVRDLINDSL
ncbi:MAG: DUF4157 domain-containing protein, partial [Phaeodactylibacter sp.]|nr:DUF4157 domain-containing protein [Phaeodactylibacter sp.]